ncbi:hypothetical protein [Merismopedia glauca]|uniref:Uncharacterized protein n=1 Tax=Merismopedia glauca CCAP 1448/3 TaxID=1296344 RepID=A0A2T1C6T0_9CYAN|nr:hypothetical protein [Merismopedia glauca]PSB03985.1 hypothetical protein C7B64_05955 [Merismopedia glauca CCAP 1448/3]
MKLTDLVAEYRSLFEPEQEKYYDFYRNLPFKKAIELAFKSEYQGKIHGHQCRIGRRKLNEVADMALQKIDINNIKSFNEFDKIYQFVEDISNSGIGPLAKYDFSLRIAVHCQVMIDKVYCHAGTTYGARALGIKVDDGDKLNSQVFPKPLNQMRADHIENFLCIYKDRLKGLNRIVRCL